MTRFLFQLVRGLIAGAFGTWVMGKVTSFLYDHEGRRAREREDALRGGRTAHEAAAERVAHLAGREVSPEQRARLGKAMGWAVGLIAGVVYAFGTGRSRRRLWAGPAFGTGFFLTMDEGINAALGVSRSPEGAPWQAHARSFAGHVAYGVAADAAMRVTEPIARRIAGRKDEVEEESKDA